LNQIYVSTSGGVKATQPVAGTVPAKGPDQRSADGAVPRTTHITGDAARNLANNTIANTGHRTTSTGAAVSTVTETMVPLSAFAHFVTGCNTPPSVTHLNLSVAATISLILAPGVSLSQATAAVEDQVRQLGMPPRSSCGCPGPVDGLTDDTALRAADCGSAVVLDLLTLTARA
jgi:multidrug efflux pump